METFAEIHGQHIPIASNDLQIKVMKKSRKKWLNDWIYYWTSIITYIMEECIKPVIQNNPKVAKK